MTFCRHAAIAIALAALSGCGQDNAADAQRALDTAGTASVICLGRDAEGGYTRGLARSECVDLRETEDQRLHALVTQPETGEVALVDLVEREALDFEPTQPGFSFMPVGALPDVVVSSPGGAASFVTVQDPGREGVFALPSSCVGTRPTSAPLRDIRTWPACRLPARPGPLLMLNDPRFDHDADATTPALVRPTCDAEYVDPLELVGQSPAAQRASCAADLAAEALGGRPKLAVALPGLSEIWILDAQALLDRTPGSFDACEPERRVRLGAAIPEIAQVVPPDLVSAPECSPTGLNHGPAPDQFQPAPADFALDDEQRLFVADSEAPLVHVLDASDPCALSPLPPLRPLSFNDPNAVITTRRIAVSPLTALGKRYLYAVDDSATETAGSLMAFDVSPDSLERTPIVRPRAAFNPGELPDRIGGSRNVADVEFVFQDNLDFAHQDGRPRVSGYACNPDPDVPEDAPGAEYRSRARASTLRGTFAFAALQSGQISVIDVEDLDAACRRPASFNPDTAREDLFGCRGDDPTLPSTGYAGTVTGELSCNVVEPHRNRSRSAFTNAFGGRSGGILSFPTLTLDTGRAAATDQSDDGRDRPKMLGARHSADPSASEQLYVGPLIYDTDDPGSRLELDPALADRSSLLLSYNEPRVFFPNEEFIATYEGVVRAPALARFSVEPGASVGVVSEGQNASFCSSGIEDMELAAARAERLGVTGTAARAGFARRHADYAQLLGELLEESDSYWDGAGATCGSELFQSDVAGAARQSGRRLCEQFFGPANVPSPDNWRDLRIVRASEDQLEVEPRNYDPALDSEARRRQLLEFVACCFPDPVPFAVRGGHQWVVDGSQSGVQHRITADPSTQRCVEDCSPARARLEGRAFEISCSEDCPVDEQGRAAIGVAGPGEAFACVVDDAAAGGILPGEPGSECVFQSLTTRFALYRGQRPSSRGMRFRWQLASGFTPMSISLLTNESTRSTPLDLQVVPELNLVMVTDGSARGVTFVSPRSLAATLSIF